MIDWRLELERRMVLMGNMSYRTGLRGHPPCVIIDRRGWNAAWEGLNSDECYLKHQDWARQKCREAQIAPSFGVTDIAIMCPHCGGHSLNTKMQEMRDRIDRLSAALSSIAGIEDESAEGYLGEVHEIANTALRGQI